MAAMDLRATIDGGRPTAEQADTLLNLGDAYHERRSLRTSPAPDPSRRPSPSAPPCPARAIRCCGANGTRSAMWTSTPVCPSRRSPDSSEPAHSPSPASRQDGPAATMLLAQATALRALERHGDAVRAAKQADAAAKDARMDPILRTEIQAAAGILLVDANDAAGAVAVLQPLANRHRHGP